MQTPSISNEEKVPSSGITDVPLSIPSATDFINKVIHSELTHGEDSDSIPPSDNDTRPEDILVLNTQPEDYAGFEIPDSEFSIPESQVPLQSPVQSQDLVLRNEPSSSPVTYPKNSTLASAIVEVPVKSFPVKNNCSRGLLQIIVPFTDFLTCTESNCFVKFFGQTFSKAVHMLLNHLHHFHKLI